MSIRPNDILHYGGGECFQKFGVPFWGMSGRQRIAPTFARADAVGPITGRDGQHRQAAANRLRAEWDDDVAGLLIESPSCVNLISSDNFSSGWSDTGGGTVGVTPTADTDLTGYTLEDDEAGSPGQESRVLAVTFTGDGVKSGCWVIREHADAPPQGSVLGIVDTTAFQFRSSLLVTWSGGVPVVSSASAGVFLGQRRHGDKWVIYFQTDAVTAVSDHEAWARPAGVTGEVGKLDVFRCNAFNAASPPWSVLNASQTKATETLSLPFAHPPQATCGHVRFRELEVPTWTLEGSEYRALAYIGQSGNVGPRLLLRRTDGNDSYIIGHHNGTSEVTASVDINPQWGDLIDLWWWLYADGSVNIAGRRQALGSSTWSAITTGTPSGALALATGWSGKLVHYGSVGSTGRGSMILRRSLIARGNHSTDDLSAAFAWRAAA